MTCNLTDCLKKAEQAIKQKLLDGGVELEQDPKIEAILVATNLNFKTRTFSNLEWQEKRTRKNGTVTIKKMKSTLTHAFCPFCGQKIGE